MRRILRLYLDTGTCNGVARRLMEDDVPAPRGDKWWGDTIKGILTNPVYAGCNVYGRHEKGDTRVKPREEWTVVPGMREAVVPEAMFREVQAATGQLAAAWGGAVHVGKDRHATPNRRESLRQSS